MLARLFLSLVVVGWWIGLASADEPPPVPAPTPVEAPAPPPPPVVTPPVVTPPVVTPPVTGGPTIVTGRVTDVRGRPIPNARVYVLARRGQPHESKTDRDGRYRIQVPSIGTHGVVIAIDKAHTFRSVLVKRGVTNVLDVDVELDIDGGEVIRIEDKKRPMPAVKPKPLQSAEAALPYSDEAVERDAWARAWLLLDIDETGSVSRLKMLKRPGFALERICLVEAFKLRFTPALDGKGRPMKTYVLWKMEWPSWGWLVQGNGTAVHRPADADALHSYTQNIRHGTEGTDLAQGVPTPIGGPWSRPLPSGTAFGHSLARVPCAGTGPLNLDLRNRAYRDCSEADMSKADALPWITRETTSTAILEMTAPDLMLVEERRGSRVPGFIGLGVTGALVVATVVSYLQFDRYEDRMIDNAWKREVYPEEYLAMSKDRGRWGKLTAISALSTLAAGGVSLFIWNRHASRRSFSVQPTTSDDGAGAQLTLTW